MVDQLSRAPRIASEAPRCQLAALGLSGLCPWACRFDQRSGDIGPVTLGLWFRPALPGDSGQGLSACGVKQLSHVTWAGVQGPAELTSCLGGLGPVSEGPHGLTAVPGDSGQGPRAFSVD